jgi:multiple sugar transport system permease protein
VQSITLHRQQGWLQPIVETETQFKELIMAMVLKKRKVSLLERRERFWGWLFLSPWIIGFLVFSVGPMLASLVLSFTNANLVSGEPAQFVGFRNWIQMLHDPIIFKSLGVTLRYIVIVVPFLLVVPLFLALLLNSSHLKGKSVFRSLFFLPQLIPGVVVGLVWLGTLSPKGQLNHLLELVGIQGPNWFNQSEWVMPAIALIGLWSIGGTLLTFIAGLKNTPKELYEAATIDGANPVQAFFNITIPMLSPILFYNLVLGAIGAFQYFTVSFILYRGQGGPNDAALFYMLVLYKEAFTYFNMGYSSTLAWAVFILCMLVTVVLFGTAKRWVYYAGEEH